MTNMDPISPRRSGGPPEGGRCALLFDGACPFCSREAALLRRADGAGRMRFVDISDSAFDPAVYGLTRAEVEAQLHFFDEAGRLWRAMEAVRAAYRTAGLGRRMAWTGVPLLRPVFDRLYRVFARNRVRWGGGWMRLSRRFSGRRASGRES
jgi:predicted DCC family thiol-disulfide oxidoreductase YuxK